MQRTQHGAGHKVRTYSMNACRLNNDHFLREMPPASSRAAVLGILTADITDLPISLPHVPLKSCQGGAKIKVTPADAGKVFHIGAIRGSQPVSNPPQCQLASRPLGPPVSCLTEGSWGQ